MIHQFFVISTATVTLTTANKCTHLRPLVVCLLPACTVVVVTTPRPLFLQHAGINECVLSVDAPTSPCQNNATCIDEIGRYRCVCVDDFTGVNCTEKGISWLWNTCMSLPGLSPRLLSLAV